MTICKHCTRTIVKDHEDGWERVCTVSGSGSSWDPHTKYRVDRWISINNDGPEIRSGDVLYRRTKRVPAYGWIDPEATGDDSIWRETCDAHDTFVAEHEPVLFEAVALLDVCLCPTCGSPDVREVVRYGRTRGEETEYFVDHACIECGRYDVDKEGGI